MESPDEPSDGDEDAPAARDDGADDAPGVDADPESGASGEEHADGAEESPADADEQADAAEADGPVEETDEPVENFEERIEKAREVAPPLDRDEALRRKEEREDDEAVDADAEGDADDAEADDEGDVTDAEADDSGFSKERSPDSVVPNPEDYHASSGPSDADGEDAADADADGEDAADADADGADAADADADDEAGSDPDATESATAGGASPAGGVTDDDELLEGPETDEEMPLANHIEEMMRRLAIVFLVGGLATLAAFPEATRLVNYFWSYHIPNPMENRPRLYGPLELVLVRLKVAGLAGVVVGLPVFVYQTYRFMRPGLYPGERRYYLAAVPTSLVLGSIGVAFAHFLVLPAIFSYFTTYTEGAATIAFGLAETFNLIVVMLAFMAVVFQIPLFIMLAIMMNLVTREWLEDKRLIFWGAFLGIAFIFSPDPTGMAPIIVTMTMIVLYEGTLALLRWTGN